jgi:imidazolonepropionase-like amidohydrolase
MGYGVAQVELPYQATMAARLGLPTYPALRAITIAPAEGFGIADEVGSIEVGKDADLGIWTGNPIDPRSSCEMTIVDGQVVYDASKVKRRQY